MDFLKHFKGLPAPLLLMLGICIVAGKFLLGVDPPRAWPFVLILLLAIAVAGYLYALDRRREKAEGAAQELRHLVEVSLGKEGEQRDCWTRPMLQLPLNQVVADRVLQLFDAAVGEATRSLREVMLDAEPSNIRANIFLPTSEGARDGDVCNLMIPRHDLAAPEGLQRNMCKGDELNIAFRPNQGATGRAFVERRAIGVLTHPSWLAEQDRSKRRALERWVYVRLHPDADFNKAEGSLLTVSGKFEMTDFQNRRASQGLAWIISMPIFLDTDGTIEVVGVFNVDCLEYQVKPEQLRAIYYRVAPFAAALSGVLRGQPTDRVAIFRLRGNRR